jgi:CDP-glycerol glycerophosphotransferase
LGISVRKLFDDVVKPFAIWFARQNVVVDTVLKAILRVTHSIRFALARARQPEERQTVLFFSFQGKKYADSPRAIFEEMVRDPRFTGWKFIWALSGADRAVFDTEFAADDRIAVVSYSSPQFFSALARAKYWVSNSHVIDGVTPTPSTVYLQTWHGSPLKRLGADIPVAGSKMPRKARNQGGWYRLQASKWTFLTSQSPYFTEKISSAFRLGELNDPPKILETGLPRNSNLFAESSVIDARATKLRQQLGLPAGKKVALYAPTFRDNQYSSSVGYTYDLGLDFARLRDQIGDEWVVLFRAHYFVASSVNVDEFDGFVVDVSDRGDINDLFIVADALVTDYSSSMIDFTHTGKPIVIYAYDLDEYGNELRGFYFPISEFPGPVFTEQDELAAAMNDLDNLEAQWAPRRKAFRDTFAQWDSKDSTRAVIAAVFQE